ncbi:MAG: PAS domain S-box protein [Deltaproteobacteria bacterium]|nr:PAS domain S-box protein [Deltaproteobacteria bacterium]
MRFSGTSLFSRALVALFLIILPILITFVFSYQRNKEHLKRSVLDDITVMAESYEGQVYQYLEMSKRRALDFSTDGHVRAEMRRFASWDAAAAKRLGEYLRKEKLVLDEGIGRISVISPYGMVMASTDKGFMGVDVSKEAFFMAGKSRPFIAEHDFGPIPGIIIAVPVLERGRDGVKTIGVLVNFVRLSGLNGVLKGEFNRDLGALTWSKGRRKTMEVYLVNRERLMITESIFIKDSVLKTKVDTLPVNECLNGTKEVSAFYNDYRGIEVAGASMCLPGLKWTLLAEVDSSEVLAPLEDMYNDALTGGLIASGLIVGLFAFFYRAVIRRLVTISSAAAMIAEGGYGATVPVMARDEIGALSEAFNRMSREIKARADLLRESEEKYRTLVSNIPDVVWTAAEDGRVVFTSANVTDVMGYTPEEIYADPRIWFSSVHPDDLGSVTRAYSDLFSMNKGFDEEYRMRIKDGQWIWVNDRATATYEKDGTRYADGVFTDITERKLAEERVERLTRLYAVLSRINEAIVRIREIERLYDEACRIAVKEGGFLFAWIGVVDEGTKSVKPVASASHGKCPDYIPSLDISILDEPLGRGPTGTAVREGRNVVCNDIAGDPLMAPWRERALECGFRSSASIPLWKGVKPAGAMSFYSGESGAFNEEDVHLLESLAADISYAMESIDSERKARTADEARRDLALKYEDLANNLTVGIFRTTAGPDSRFVEVNRALVEMFEASSREELMKTSVGFFHQDPVRREELQKRLAQGGFIRGEEAELKTFKGRRFWGSVSAVSKTKDGEVFLDGFIEDITERKKLEEQFRQAQKMEAVGQLAGGVAHDFNNILTALIGYGNLLIMKKGNDDLVRSYADHMLTLSEKAASLTQGLLAFSRKQVLNPQPTDMNELVRRVEKILKRLIGEDIELTASFSGEPLIIRADSTQIEHVLMNLATNARDAMPGGGRIAIATEACELGREFVDTHGAGAPGRYAVIAFSDTGAGMSEEVVKRIFEPFFTTKEVGKGTGLGLSMVYGIIKQHNGFIDIASKPGEGTTFRIYLPFADEAAGHPEPQKFLVRGGSETVLLAEDEEDVRNITKTMLQEFGYRVITAVDGEDAFAKFMEHKDSIDLLVLDIVMPKKAGNEVYEMIRSVRPDVKVLFTSGYSSDIVRSKGLAGERDFISKPVSPSEFLKRVREVIER